MRNIDATPTGMAGHDGQIIFPVVILNKNPKHKQKNIPDWERDFLSLQSTNQHPAIGYIYQNLTEKARLFSVTSLSPEIARLRLKRI